MGDLSKIPLKGVYDTEVDDVVTSFYVPMLSNCKSYDRLSGFFRSSVLSISSAGIIELIQNHGHMRLVCSPVLSKSDADALNRCFDDPQGFEKILSDSMMCGMTEDFLNNDSSQAMAWMLLNHYLDIHIVVMKNSIGQIVSSEDESAGMFHTKLGIFKDEEENIVSFSGSINETYNGLVDNIEEFDVFCSWKVGSNEHIYSHIDKFERYWNVGKRQRSETISLPNAVKKEWVKIAPSDCKDLRLFKKKTGQFSLRDYQKDAIGCWAFNNYRGIFNMATGTGKTITSIFAVKKLISEINGKYILIVAVPYQHLIKNPWETSLNKFLFENRSDVVVIEAYGDSNKWHRRGGQFLIDFTVGLIDSITFIVTYDTLHTEKFQSLVDRFCGKKIIIADEVHNAGADIYRNGLREEYEYRLGLSATPARYLDDEGTDFLFNYFEKEVYTFSLEKAINTINPDTGETFLTSYYYYPIFISLTEDELALYSKYSAKISKCIPKDKEPTSNQIKILRMLLLQRARIIKNASKKLATLIELMPEFKQKGLFDHCLIYCSDGKDPEDDSLKTIQRIARELNSRGISYNRFTAEEKIGERQKILDDFASGSISTIVAIKCLDEGVDIPETRNAIIMASTGNPREYIQRRGRILRRFKGKEYSVLYDFIVVPGHDDEYTSDEIQILKAEYARFKEFSDLSLNKDDNEKLMNRIMKKCNVYMGG